MANQPRTAPPARPSAQEMADILKMHAEVLDQDVVADALQQEASNPGTLLKAVNLVATGEMLGAPQKQIDQATRQFVKDPSAGNLQQIEVDLVVDARGLPQVARSAGMTAKQLLYMEGSFDGLGEDGSAARSAATYDAIRQYGFRDGMALVAKKIVAEQFGVDSNNFEGLTLQQVMNVIADAQRRKQDNVITKATFWQRVRAKWGRKQSAQARSQSTKPAQPLDPNILVMQTIRDDGIEGQPSYVYTMTVYKDLSFTISVLDTRGRFVAQRKGVMGLDGWTACYSPDDPTRVLPAWFAVNQLCGMRSGTATPALSQSR
jgi:hypothetical protein